MLSNCIQLNALININKQKLFLQSSDKINLHARRDKINLNFLIKSSNLCISQQMNEIFISELISSYLIVQLYT